MSKDFSNLVGEALGRASVAWSKIPSGIFDSDTCSALHIDIMNAHNKEIKKLQAENAKLKECVNIYANKYAWHGTHINSDDLWFDETQGYFTGGKHARQVLKELEDK